MVGQALSGLTPHAAWQCADMAEKLKLPCGIPNKWRGRQKGRRCASSHDHHHVAMESLLRLPDWYVRVPVLAMHEQPEGRLDSGRVTICYPSLFYNLLSTIVSTCWGRYLPKRWHTWIDGPGVRDDLPPFHHTIQGVARSQLTWTLTKRIPGHTQAVLTQTQDSEVGRRVPHEWCPS